MTAVGEWLRQIVLIVMFAVIADLLLPNKEMQRYMRMVLGLAVIAAMLQPLHVLVQSGWSDRLAGAAASEVLSGTNSDANSASVKEFEAVVESEQTRQANQYLAQSLTSDIEAKFGVPVSSVHIQGQVGTGALRVDVDVPSYAGDPAEVQDFVASTLAIPAKRVNVTTNGG